VGRSPLEGDDVRQQQVRLRQHVDGDLDSHRLVLLLEDQRESDPDGGQVRQAEEPGEGRRPRGVGGVGQRAADGEGGDQIDHEDRLALRVDRLTGQLAGEDAGQQREAREDEAEGEEEKNEGHGILPETRFRVGRVSRLRKEHYRLKRYKCQYIPPLYC